jgi:hypothetical protein
MTLALAQVFHLGNARSRGPVIRASAALSNPYAVGALVLSIALQIAPMYVDPLARILRVAPLTAPEWLVVIGCSSVTAVAGQALRLVRARRRETFRVCAASVRAAVIRARARLAPGRLDGTARKNAPKQRNSDTCAPDETAPHVVSPRF